MLLENYYVHAFVLLFFGAVMCEITGPKELAVTVGEDANFTWSASTTKIHSATWGIKKGTNADPQYITVDIRKNKAHINPNLDPKLFDRLSFVGDLSKGLAWFILRRVTVNDSNTYITSIIDAKNGLLPYTTVLIVKSKEDAEYPSASTVKETTRRPLTMTHLQGSTSYTTVSRNETRVSKEEGNPVYTTRKTNVIITILTVVAIWLAALAYVIIFRLRKMEKCTQQPRKKKSLMQRRKLIVAE